VAPLLVIALLCLLGSGAIDVRTASAVLHLSLVFFLKGHLPILHLLAMMLLQDQMSPVFLTIFQLSHDLEEPRRQQRQ
jgi:hypothetical protein